jgi:hypothetical protein
MLRDKSFKVYVRYIHGKAQDIIKRTYGRETNGEKCHIHDSILRCKLFFKLYVHLTQS